jgi:hypothetical protein
LKGNGTPITCWLIVAKGITLELVWVAWSLFAFFFTSLFVTSLHVTTNIVGVLWKLITFMSTPFRVSMDLYEDLKFSST